MVIKKMTKKIKDEIKGKEQFFACISHELRNPLNSLLGSLEVISCSKIIDMDVLNSAQLCGETLLNLIGNILDFSKIQSEKMEIVSLPTDLRDKIRNSLRMFKSLAKKKNIQIKSIMKEDIPPAILLDWHKLNQVLINLVGNSIKFTERGGIYVNVEWFPLFGNISTTEIENQLQNILSYSSREDLMIYTENFLSLAEEYENRLMPDKYVFFNKGMVTEEDLLGESSSSLLSIYTPSE